MLWLDLPHGSHSDQVFGRVTKDFRVGEHIEMIKATWRAVKCSTCLRRAVAAEDFDTHPARLKSTHLAGGHANIIRPGLGRHLFRLGLTKQRAYLWDKPIRVAKLLAEGIDHPCVCKTQEPVLAGWLIVRAAQHKSIAAISSGPSFAGVVPA